MQDNPTLINTEKNEFEQWQSKTHKDLSSNNSDSHTVNLRHQLTYRVSVIGPKVTWRQSQCGIAQQNIYKICKEMRKKRGTNWQETGREERNKENLSRTMLRAGVKKSKDCTDRDRVFQHLILGDSTTSYSKAVLQKSNYSEKRCQFSATCQSKAHWSQAEGALPLSKDRLHFSVYFFSTH